MLAKPLSRHTFAAAVERVLGARHDGDATAAADAPSPPGEGKCLRLLAVDDNDANRRLLGELLAGPGLEVTLASSGEQALALGHRQHFDLVLMDIRMPGMDGIAASRALRRLDEAWGRTPIVAVTAHALEEERRRLLASGLDDVLIKPLDADDLAALLARHLGDAPEHFRSPLAPPARPQASELPTVDLALGARLAGGREALARRLLEQLAASLDESEAALRRAHREQDDEALLDAIHALNGACRYCGAPHLGLLAETMETRLRTRGREAMTPLLEDLFAAMAALRRWCDEHPWDAQPSSTTKATANSTSSDNDR